MSDPTATPPALPPLVNAQLPDAGNTSSTLALPRARKRMRVGINYMWAWNKYGVYFGPHWRTGETPREPEMDDWIEKFEQRLQIWKRMGVDLTRIFVLCNLQTVGNVDSTGLWQPAPTADPRFFDHMDRMLAACQRTGFQIIPSFMDFGIGKKDTESEKRFRAVTEPSIYRKLFQDYLDPFLTISTKYKSSIYAWEVMNEPIWLSSALRPDNYDYASLVSDTALTRFLQEGVTRIEAAGFESTVGHRYYEDLKKFPTGTKPQFHYYPRLWNADPRSVPSYGSDETKAFVGEFATNHDGDLWNIPDDSASDPRKRTYVRLRELDARGYPMSMLWPNIFDPTMTYGDDPKLTPSVEAGIMDFMRI